MKFTNYMKLQTNLCVKVCVVFFLKFYHKCVFFHLEIVNS